VIYLRKLRRLLPLAMAAGLALTLYVWTRDGRGREAQVTTHAAAADSGSTGTVGQPAASATLDVGPDTVRGWEGTVPDGELRLDARGHLLIDLALRRRCDYLLSARGVLSEAQMLNRLEQQASKLGFTMAQRAELSHVFANYLRYLSGLATISVDPSSLGSVRTANQLRQQLRRATLGVTVSEAFFSLDEIEENHALARMEVLQDQALTPSQRDARLAALLNDLPPELRMAERDSRTLERLDAKVQALGSAAADPAQVYAARAEVVGAEAAQRLAVLDTEDTVWAARMQALEAEQRRILADQNLSATEHQRTLDDYIDREFSSTEALRARSHLSIAAESRGRTR
jgi:lipase chaperone LimK